MDEAQSTKDDGLHALEAQIVNAESETELDFIERKINIIRKARA